MSSEWTTHPQAEAVVVELVASAVGDDPAVASFADHLTKLTSTRLVDWVDHIAAPISPSVLADAGFAEALDGFWRHPAAQLPAVVVSPDRVVAVRVDDATAFAAARPTSRGVLGSPMAGLRMTCADEGAVVALVGVERRSWSAGVTPTDWSGEQAAAAVTAWDLWAQRPRPLSGDEQIFADVQRRAGEMVSLVGVDLAASYVMALERSFWMRRNAVAVLQHSRQDVRGLGWGNHDHHTFRSSREWFQSLINALQTLGFSLRERFYAGAEAGWGAQVLEHAGAGLVVFADVDLEPSERDVDFAVEPLAPEWALGTVGFWCALHGESLLGAGMHHLEGQFDFDRLREDLAGVGIEHMAPFSDLPHLRQAFTAAELWPVDGSRLAALVDAGQLSADKAADFTMRGAPGSHLENLARRGGFKGFNQHNVSATMRVTDPRSYA